MKKLILFFSLSFLVLYGPKSQAQSNTSRAAKAGDQMCDCINEMMDQLHHQLKIFVREMDLYGKEMAEENLTTYIKENPDQTESILQSAQKMTDFNSTILAIDGCADMNSVQAEAEANNPNFETEMVAYISNKAKCEYAYIFYKLGTEKK